MIPEVIIEEEEGPVNMMKNKSQPAPAKQPAAGSKPKKDDKNMKLTVKNDK